MIKEHTTLLAAIHIEKCLADLQAELNIAKTMQQAMIPLNGKPLSLSTYKIAGKMIPAKTVGGVFLITFR
jgi:hypothetical protein